MEYENMENGGMEYENMEGSKYGRITERLHKPMRSPGCQLATTCTYFPYL